MKCDNPQILLIPLPCKVFCMYHLMCEVPESQSYFVLVKRELEKMQTEGSLMVIKDRPRTELWHKAPGLALCGEDIQLCVSFSCTFHG